MTKVRVLFFSASSGFGRLIQFVTRSRFCHVGIQIGDAYYEEVNRGFVASAPRSDYAAVAELDALLTLDTSLFLARTVGQPYSWSTILADLVAAYTPFKWQIEKRGEHVCSGAVAWLLCLMGHLPFSVFDYQPDSVSPGELAVILGVQ